MRVGRLMLALAAAAVLAVPAFAQAVEFKDPTGDDNGPGGYSYPTDGVYKPGSFDLTGLKVQLKGDKVSFDVGVNTNLEDPWGMKTGFAVQMVFIFIKTGDGGSAEGLPGLNVKFAPGSEWNKVVILSPQGASRVKAEVGQKAASMAGNIVIPGRVRGAGRNISATVDLAELGGGDPAKWGYQVVMQSNEGFPAGTDLLTRKVNEYEGQHRFGGGTDGDCDPHAIDVLAGSGNGDAAEADAQHKMLAYECNPDGTAKTPAALTMVRK